MKGDTMDTIISRFGATTLKRALLLGVIGAMLTSYMVVNTVSSSDITPAGGGAIKLASQTFSDDTQITVSSNGIKLVPSTDGTPVGDTLGGEVEATSSLPEVTTAVTKGNYAYEFEVNESSAADWAETDGTDDLKVEVYGDNGSTTTLLATFYIKQGVLEGSSIEGVTGTVDLGSSSTIYNTFDVVITHQ
jgi:hypothetical protein